MHTLIIKDRMLVMQLCTAHEDLSEAVADANVQMPTPSGWRMVEEGEEPLCGDPAVVPCADLPGRRHIVVEC